MRLLAVAGCFVVLWGVVAVAQKAPPVKMGLWDVTIHKQTTVSPAMAAIMKRKGQKIDSPSTERWHTCMTEARWRRDEARVDLPPPDGCTLTHKSVDAHGRSTVLKCETAGGGLIVLESQFSWENHERIHLVQRLTSVPPGIGGNTVQHVDVSSRFIGEDCGPVTPGATVPVR
jgi:hypothetical protein